MCDVAKNGAEGGYALALGPDPERTRFPGSIGIAVKVDDGAERGYQPVVVLWAEQDVILHDQFREGHVPAGCGNVRVLEQAVANLPQGVDHLALRADSALYETAVLRWCEDHDHLIADAIIAVLSAPRKAEIVCLPETAWQLEREDSWVFAATLISLLNRICPSA